MRPLGISDVSRIHSQGGSILRTVRANPSRRLEDLRGIQLLADLETEALEKPQRQKA